MKKKTKKYIIIGSITLGVIILGLLFYFLVYPVFVTIEKNEELPPNFTIIKEANFIPSGGHKGEGKAILLDDGEGNLILRFEDFDTTNGPNLHIYLSEDLQANNFIDLGKIKATKGNVNYDIPDDIPIEQLDKVLVWCVPFGVLFTYADFDV